MSSKLVTKTEITNTPSVDITDKIILSRWTSSDFLLCTVVYMKFTDLQF